MTDLHTHIRVEVVYSYLSFLDFLLHLTFNILVFYVNFYVNAIREAFDFFFPIFYARKLPHHQT